MPLPYGVPHSDYHFALLLEQDQAITIVCILVSTSLSGCDTQTTGVVRCDQPRALDLRARSGRRLENVPPAIMEEVLARLETIFS